MWLGIPDMLEVVACLKMLWIVAEFELQNWRPKFQDWFAVLPLSGPHPMRILQIRNETSLKNQDRKKISSNQVVVTKNKQVLTRQVLIFNCLSPEPCNRHCHCYRKHPCIANILLSTSVFEDVASWLDSKGLIIYFLSCRPVLIPQCDF